MHTDQISEQVLTDYKTNHLKKERIDFLITQANEQLNEISQNQEIYDHFLQKVQAPQKIDTLILWILFMSNEDICGDYIYKFKKNYVDRIPVSDLADLLIHILYLHKINHIQLDGLEYLLDYEEEGIEEVDQYAFTNVLHYIQKLKEKAVEMEF